MRVSERYPDSEVNWATMAFFCGVEREPVDILVHLLTLLIMTVFKDSKDFIVEATCRLSTINVRTSFRSFLALHRPPSCPQETDEYENSTYNRYDHHGYKLTIVVVIATRFTIRRWLPRGAIRTTFNAVEIR